MTLGYTKTQLKNYLSRLDDKEAVSLFTLSNDAFTGRMELGLQDVRDSLKLAVLQVFEERNAKQEMGLVIPFRGMQKNNNLNNLTLKGI